MSAVYLSLYYKLKKKTAKILSIYASKYDKNELGIHKMNHLRW